MQNAPVLGGLILAGGRSRRFGSDKAAARLEGQTLLERAVSLMQGLIDEIHGDDIYVSVRADQVEDELRRSFRLIPDQAAELGPAGGILAAHALRPDIAWLVLACDLARMTGAGVENLVRARDPQKAATAYRSPRDDSPEPLCAIYEPDTLSRFARHVGAGGNPSPRALLERSDVALISATPTVILDNVNSPGDLVLPAKAGRVQ